MKNNLLHYAMLFCLSAIFSTAACSDSKPEETPEGNKLTKLTIEPSPLSMTVGESLQLTLTATPAEASLKNLRWSSRGTGIVTVEEGLVKALAVGSDVIVAICDGVTTTCKVEVSAVPDPPKPLQKILLTPSVLSLQVGKTADIVATMVPENAEVEGPIVWASNNPAVATIDDKGHVVTVADGKAQLTATIGTISATCHIEVYSQTSARTLSFLQLNIWEGVDNINNGRAVLYDQLVALKPDVASFCEFRSLDEAKQILAEAAAVLLERTGTPYYSTCRSGSGTRGLLTRHPILETDAVSGNSWFYRTVIDFYGQQMAIYASHAYHAYYACYLPRGYGDGGTPDKEWGISSDFWAKLPNGPITDVATILKREETSGRTQIAKDLVPDMKSQSNQGRLAIFGGDLNQPSHLDWTEAAKNNYEHAGCVVPWPISTFCYDAGVRDAFRTVYPDPVTHPGVTWPVSNKDAKKVTQWAAEADERDRIDFVYFLPDEKLGVTKAQIVGPSAMISKSQIVEDTFVNKAEELIEPANGIWPTDHRGLFITFEVKFPK